MNYAMKKYDFL